MKIVFNIVACLLVLNFVVSCRSSKKIQNAVVTKDSSVIVAAPPSTADTTQNTALVTENLKKHYINFQTFSAKIKVEYSDNKGKQPDANAFVHIKKDSLIWISINATFLNFEAFRILISKDSVWVLNKLEKQVEYHSLDYLEQVAKIPLDFKTLQDLIIGNPVFIGKTIVSYANAGDKILVSTIDEHFKNLLTLSSNDYLVQKSKLDDLNATLKRTADLTYLNYENKPGHYFSTYREIAVAAKSKVNILLNFKQYDFNTEVTFPFSIPKNYKRK